MANVLAGTKAGRVAWVSTSGQGEQWRRALGIETQIHL